MPPHLAPPKDEQAFRQTSWKLTASAWRLRSPARALACARMHERARRAHLCAAPRAASGMRRSCARRWGMRAASAGAPRFKQLAAPGVELRLSPPRRGVPTARRRGLPHARRMWCHHTMWPRTASRPSNTPVCSLLRARGACAHQRAPACLPARRRMGARAPVRASRAPRAACAAVVRGEGVSGSSLQSAAL